MATTVSDSSTRYRSDLASDGIGTASLVEPGDAPSFKNTDNVGVVVIGRNEGQRLVDCLRSLRPFIDRTVYVDSGSTDDSVQVASRSGAKVVQLDMAIPFTAARARNAGFETAQACWPDLTFVQFVDGDCELDETWIRTGKAFLDTNENAAIVFGRRRERFPDRSIFNALCDREWGGDAGRTKECGGDILARIGPFKQCGGYRSSLIAGEEPELCVRLRERGYTIWRLDAEMTRHDANIMRFAQWWRRCARAGHAFAEVSILHTKSPFAIWKRNVLRAIFWAGALPPSAIFGSLIVDDPIMVGLFALYPFQLVRTALRETPTELAGWRNALFDLLGKFPELQGILTFHLNRLRGRRQPLIEYK